MPAIALLASVAGALLAPTSIANFRDVGGLPAADGARRMRPGLLHRCASPANASAIDADAVLQELNMRVVLDLRGEQDAYRDNGPRRLAPATRFLPLMTEDMMRKALIGKARDQSTRKFLKLLGITLSGKVSPSRRLKAWLGGERDVMLASLLSDVSLCDLYWLIVNERGEQLREAAEMCASGEALPLLVHCTHGKDRTGVLISMILSACGVPEEEIIRDYSRSHEWGCSVEGRWAVRQALPEAVRVHMPDDVLQQWCEAPKEVLIELFDRIKAEYGSLTAYLDSIGIDATLRAKLVEKLTEPAV